VTTSLLTSDADAGATSKSALPIPEEGPILGDVQSFTAPETNYCVGGIRQSLEHLLHVFVAGRAHCDLLEHIDILFSECRLSPLQDRVRQPSAEKQDHLAKLRAPSIDAI
jgi:hypothetical protein